MQRRLILARIHRFVPAKNATIARRTLSSTKQYYARKDTMDKDSMNVEPNEYSKSGSDSQAAHTEAAFDPNNTSPEGQQASSDRGSAKNSPLNESPSNREFSKPKSTTSTKSEGSAAEDNGDSSRDRTSGGGSPNKQGGKA